MVIAQGRRRRKGNKTVQEGHGGGAEEEGRVCSNKLIKSYAIGH